MRQRGWLRLVPLQRPTPGRPDPRRSSEDGSGTEGGSVTTILSKPKVSSVPLTRLEKVHHKGTG